jgi:hypothetical protein
VPLCASPISVSPCKRRFDTDVPTAGRTPRRRPKLWWPQTRPCRLVGRDAPDAKIGCRRGAGPCRSGWRRGRSCREASQSPAGCRHLSAIGGAISVPGDASRCSACHIAPVNKVADPFGTQRSPVQIRPTRPGQMAYLTGRQMLCRHKSGDRGALQSRPSCGISGRRPRCGRRERNEWTAPWSLISPRTGRLPPSWLGMRTAELLTALGDGRQGYRPTRAHGTEGATAAEGALRSRTASDRGSARGRRRWSARR